MPRPEMHGGDWHAALRHLGKAPEDGLCDLSSSISPYGPGPRARTRWKTLVDELDRYPDPRYSDLMEALSLHYQVDTENLVVVAGAMEAIDALLAYLRPTRLYLNPPVFSEYQARARVHNIPVVSIQHPDEFDKSGLFIMANPVNPTGKLISEGEQMAWEESARQKGVTVVWDEAFLEFLPDWRQISRLREVNEGTHIVMGSLTKFYGLAGLRVGFLALPSSLARRLRRDLPTWHLAWPSAEVAREALMDQEYFSRTREWFIEERQWLREALGREVEWISDSVANFLLVVPKAPLLSLQGSLSDRGILIRDATSFDNVPENAVRIAVKRRHDSERLISAWREFSRRST